MRMPKSNLRHVDIYVLLRPYLQHTNTQHSWCTMRLLRDHNEKYIQQSNCWSENMNGRDRTEGKWEMILKWTLLKQSGTMWTRFIQLMAAISGWILRKLIEIWLPYNVGNVKWPVLPDVMGLRTSIAVSSPGNYCICCWMHTVVTRQ